MKHYLHYVGSKLYPKEVFIREAKELGVNRCLPLRMIKKLKWGDRILLATFIPNEITYCDCEEHKEEIIQGNICLKCKKFILVGGQKIDGRKNKKDGKAVIFGYFDIRGLNINASNEFKTALTSQLNVIESRESNLSVKRQCGSYTIGTSHIITNSIEDIIQKAEYLSEAMNEKVKFFVSGQFYPLETTIEPINFTRTLIEVEITEELTAEDVTEKKVIGMIKDYNKRTYIKKYAKRGRPKKEKNETNNSY